MKGTKRLLLTWLTLTCADYGLFYLIWWLIDKDSCSSYTPRELLLDVSYSMIYSLASLGVAEALSRRIFRKEVTAAQVITHASLVTLCNIIIFILVDALWSFEDIIHADRLLVFCIIAVLISLIYLCISYCALIIRQSRRNVEMHKELLKLQLDPHFVFNSLSTLTELISEDPQLAESFTLKFSGIYRYIVNQLNRETMTIADELRFIDDYCALLDIRHPHHFAFDIDDSLRRDNSLILPMAIQILVENAVKHNSHSTRWPLRVRIGREADYVVVSNERRPLKATLTANNKVGLKNLRERYGLLGLEPVVTEDAERFTVKVPVIGKGHKPNADN